MFISRGPQRPYDAGLARIAAIMAAAASFLALVTAGHAAERIGDTAVIHNIVEQVAATPAPIKVGDDVFANENVRTGAESAAKFVFSDQTNLALGPTSTVKLDRFVYKGNNVNYVKAAVNFTAGAFRFTTGASEKGAYELKTNTATIGVRGTVFDVLVENGESTVSLVEGAVAVCPRKNFDGDPRKLSKAALKEFHCIELTKAGQTTVVTARRAAFKATAFSFASAAGCGDGLCTQTTTTAAASTPAATSIANATPASGDNGVLCYWKP
jgi:hypothetical protein